MVEEQQQTKREAYLESETNDDILQVNKFAHELTVAYLPKYLKDLYVNFTFPAGLAHTLKDKKMTEANTIRSYENHANGKLTGQRLKIHV